MSSHIDREALGIRVRQVWMEWAKQQPERKPSWLVTWEELTEEMREVDRQIGATIAEEAWEEADEEIEELTEKLEAARVEAASAQRVAAAWEGRMRQESERTPWIVWVSWASLVMGCVSCGLLTNILLHPSPPLECPPPPDPVVCPPVEECNTPTITADDNGYSDSDGMQHDWPDMGSYSPVTFREDCHAVCTSPGGGGHDEPGRVLLMDPEHLVCVCLHRQSIWPIDRYVGWERIR